MIGQRISYHDALQRLAMPALALLVTALIYRDWFLPGAITAGDWGYYTLHRMLDFWPTPSLWDASQGTGGYTILSVPLFPQLSIEGLLAQFGIPFSWSERLLWMLPTTFVACVGGYVFSYSLFKSRAAAAITGVFMVANSYTRIINGGGQFTVGVAFALMPLIVWSYRTALHRGEVFRYLRTALLCGVQAMYDLRLTYITIWMLVLYIPFALADRARGTSTRRLAVRLGAQGLVCLVVDSLIHAPLILPSLLVRVPALPAGYNSVAQVHSLSFVRLVHGLDLQHPFWPLNELGVFGPVDPLFFAIALLAFLPLLTAWRAPDVQYLYALYLLGVFLVKGSNPPAGQAYDWLFVHVPGFSAYRDSSKFYQPLMVGAGALAGLAAALGIGWAERQLPRRVSPMLAMCWFALCFALILYPSMPVLSQSVASYAAQTYRPRRVPSEYVPLNAMIDGQQEFFRTLWFPGYDRFGTYSERHPAVDAATIGTQYFASSLPEANNPASWLHLPGARHVLEDLSVKYVIVPLDTLHYIFASADQNSARQLAIDEVRRDLRGFREERVGTLHVFVNPHFLPEVYVPSRVMPLQSASPYPRVDAIRLLLPPTHPGGPPVTAATVPPGTLPQSSRTAYAIPSHSLPRISVRGAGAGRLDVEVRGATQPFLTVFLQTYDPNWQAFILPKNTAANWWTLTQTHAIPQRYHVLSDGYANAWWIAAKGSFTLALAYWPQGLLSFGWIVSWLTMLSSTCYAIVAGSKARFRVARSLERRSLTDVTTRVPVE